MGVLLTRSYGLGMTSHQNTDSGGTRTATTIDIRPFRVAIPQAALDDLRERVDRTRYPRPAPGDSWDYGTPR